MAKGHIFIGTSGWVYSHWEKLFYPEDLKDKNRLQFYAQHFPTVEINNTFYRIPSEKAVKNWKATVPRNFIFSIKASQYITHRKRLIDSAESLQFFLERIALLEQNLGPILFQLPPSFKQNLTRLEEFLEQLKGGGLYAFEFRHPSWFQENTYDLLRKHTIALVITDLKGNLSSEEITAPFTYIRLHGPTIKAYQGLYGKELLNGWKLKIRDWSARNIAVYCYFDNDEKAYAIKDAQTLIGLV